MNDNLSDTIVLSVIWIAAAVGCVALKAFDPFLFAVIGTAVYLYISR